MKTAMQQLLDKFRVNKWYSADEIEQEFLDFGLPLEKEQIVDACNEGFNDGNEYVDLLETVGENYFNKTYQKQ